MLYERAKCCGVESKHTGVTSFRYHMGRESFNKHQKMASRVEKKCDESADGKIEKKRVR